MILLHIKCKNESEETQAMRDMGLETSEVIDYRPFRIKWELIDGFYPDTVGGCFIFVCGDQLCVKESFEELNEILT